MMTYKYGKMSPVALDELKEARLNYKLTRVKGLSNRFSKAVNATIKQVLKNPGAYAIRYKNVRIAYTATFPYPIHFYTEKESVIIIAIIYERRDPESTFKRL